MARGDNWAFWGDEEAGRKREAILCPGEEECERCSQKQQEDGAGVCVFVRLCVCVFVCVVGWGAWWGGARRQPTSICGAHLPFGFGTFSEVIAKHSYFSIEGRSGATEGAFPPSKNVKRNFGFDGGKVSLGGNLTGVRYGLDDLELVARFTKI